jgi:hypothetical protein
MTNDLKQWIEDEQCSLWTDLESAIHSSYNGVWSMHCAETARRIVGAARLVGPTPIAEVPWVISGSGIYEALLHLAEITPGSLIESDLSSAEKLMTKESYPGRKELRERYARTLAYLAKPSEVAYILDYAS